MPASKNQQDNQTVHLICQRYRQCKILLDEREWRLVGSHPDSKQHDADTSSLLPPHCGWLVYTSFAKGTTMASVQKAVLTLIQMPFGTWGLWQEKRTERPQSLQAMMQQGIEDQQGSGNGNHHINDTPRLSVVLCPQANLVSQVKRNGKSVQYHGQCDKNVSQQWFAYFYLYLKALLVETECQLRQEDVPKALLEWKDLEDLEQALEMANASSWTADSSLQLQLVTVVQGSFGKRQGIEFLSDMGPFCHSFQV